MKLIKKTKRSEADTDDENDENIFTTFTQKENTKSKLPNRSNKRKCQR